MGCGASADPAPPVVQFQPYKPPPPQQQPQQQHYQQQQQQPQQQNVPPSPPPPYVQYNNQRQEQQQQQPQRQQDEDEPKDLSEKITAEQIEEFIRCQKTIIEVENAEESYLLLNTELDHVKQALQAKTTELTQLEEIMWKEYKDIERLDREVQSYFGANHQQYIAEREKEILEYQEAKNKVEVCKIQLSYLGSQQPTIEERVNEAHENVNRLEEARKCLDALLESLFNDEYGSEAEYALELAAEHLFAVRQSLTVTHQRWNNAQQLFQQACAQMSYVYRRWMQIKQVPKDNNQARFYLATDTRNYMIKADQNCRRAAEYVNITSMPYWTMQEFQNMAININLIYKDVTTSSDFDRALAWYKYYHWRMALQAQWIAQVINSKILVDLRATSDQYKDKSGELRAERVRLMKELAVSCGFEANFQQLEQQAVAASVESAPVTMVGDDDEGDTHNEEAAELGINDIGELQQDPCSVQDILQEDQNRNHEMVVDPEPQEPDEPEKPTDTEVDDNKEPEQPLAQDNEPDLPPSETDLPSENISPEVTPETMPPGDASDNTPHNAEDNSENIPFDDTPENTPPENSPEDIAPERTSENIPSEDIPNNTPPEDTSENIHQSIPPPAEETTQPPLEVSSHNEPAMKPVPLSELAPVPTDDVLFGDIAALQEAHRRQMQNYERVQNSNKSRQEQGLKQKLTRIKHERAMLMRQRKEEADLLNQQNKY